MGKIIGIFGYGFGTNCWADEVPHPDPNAVTFRVYPSTKTVDDELEALREERLANRERALAQEVRRKTTELEKAHAQLREYSLSLEAKVHAPHPGAGGEQPRAATSQGSGGGGQRAQVDVLGQHEPQSAPP